MTSNHGVSAVLSQIQEERKKVIAYFSKVFSKTEKNYCIIRRELAVVDSFKSFHHYLYGKKFVIRTDHTSLRWLMSFRNLEGQLARWLKQIQQYDFEIIHRKENLHRNADGLSRRPCEKSNCNYCNKLDLKKEKLVSRIVLDLKQIDWKKKQFKGPLLKKIIYWKKVNYV